MVTGMIRKLCFASSLIFIVVAPAAPKDAAVSPAPKKKPREIKALHFESSERCVSCHNGMTTSTGEDVSIGTKWRTSMMANAARDPYWMAGVRRETVDHPTAASLIQDECSVCHLPMARTEAKMMGQDPEIFSHYPPNPKKEGDRLAVDGVSCSLCHQILPQNLGTRQSFIGGYVIDAVLPKKDRKVFGPYEIDSGHTRIMRSSAGFEPTQAGYFRQSEMCATCHTLYTSALNDKGEVVGELPEQVPYQEWLESDYKTTRSCQSCHMPAVGENVPISSVLAKPRENVAQHTFLGGNFFMQRLLNKFRNEMWVLALPQEMDAAASRTVEHLQAEAARLQIASLERREGRLVAEITVENLGGHKLPTAYPSRRVWLHVTARDQSGRAIFESGAFTPQGRIQGNDNDADPMRWEPHYSEITSPDQVQIYETILGAPDGKPTTGLLTALDYLKDNRLLPKGFDKSKAAKDIAVHGEAQTDPDFQGGGDRIRYVIPAGPSALPLTLEAELWYQPVAYRWAENLKHYDQPEPRRFVGFYESLAEGSAIRLTGVRRQER